MFLIGIYIILVIASYYNKVNDLYVRTGILLLGIISIFLSVSTSDYPTYEKFFNDIEPLDQIIAGKDQVFLYDFNNFELGYKLLNSFFKTLLPYVEVLYILSNIGIYIAVYFFLRNKAENLYKLILPHFTFFFIAIQAGIIRQAIAIVIFYHGLKFLIKRKLILYLLITAICFLFHASAILLPLLYFFVHRKFSDKVLSIVIVIGLLIYLKIIPYDFLDLLAGIGDFILPSAGNKLIFYIAESQQLGAPNRLNLAIVENIFIFIILLLIRRDMQARGLWTDFLNLCLNLSVVYIFLFLYFFDLYTFVYRINYYFIFFKFIIIVSYIERQEGWKKFYVHTALVIYCGIMLASKILQGY